MTKNVRLSGLDGEGKLIGILEIYIETLLYSAGERRDILAPGPRPETGQTNEPIEDRNSLKNKIH